MWDPIVSVPDHCLSFYLVFNQTFRPLDSDLYFSVMVFRIVDKL